MQPTTRHRTDYAPGLGVLRPPHTTTTPSPSPIVLMLTRSVLLLLLLVLAGSTVPANAAANKPRQVVFIRYPIEPNHFNGQLHAFRATMSHMGYAEGKQVEYIDVLTKTASQDSAHEVVAAVEKYKHSADIFVTCGWVSMVARPLLAESGIPQLFVPVLESVALSMLPSLTAPPQTNLSGIYLMYPPEKVLRLAKLVIPTLRRYAYIYDSRIPADASFKKAYERLPASARHGITVHFLDLAGGVDTVLTQLRQQQIQAFGGIVGAFQHRHALNSSNLPAITAFTLDIEPSEIIKYSESDNTVAGLFNSFLNAGEQAARMTASIFEKKTAIGNMPPQPAKQMTFLDLRNAKRLGLTVPFSAVEAVDQVVR